MHNLLLLRHAKAQWAEPQMRDFDRPLAEEGLASIQSLADAMLKAGTIPERILVSAARRTRQTAEILVSFLQIDIECVIDETLYNSNANTYMKAIRNYADAKCLMLIAHNPSIEDLALALCGDGKINALKRLEAGFPTAGLATISFQKPLNIIARGDGFLQSFPYPEPIS